MFLSGHICVCLFIFVSGVIVIAYGLSGWFFCAIAAWPGCSVPGWQKKPLKSP